MSWCHIWQHPVLDAMAAASNPARNACFMVLNPFSFDFPVVQPAEPVSAFRGTRRTPAWEWHEADPHRTSFSVE